jgi:4-hydroxy-4-methyl-2-oxoglutarate aldolase
MPVVVRHIPRVKRSVVEKLGGYGVATIHEAQGRIGLLASRLRPIYRPIHAAGTAVTCEVAPGDNWTIHVAVEQCQLGDILVVTPTSPSSDGYFGELLATSLVSRGVVGLIIDAGVRDVAALTEMKFPVWTKTIFAQGTVKETLGNVNTAIICGGAIIHPGDTIVADDDGVCVVKREDAANIAELCHKREDKERATRERLKAGELGLDIYDMREKLKKKGLTYIDRTDKG